MISGFSFDDCVPDILEAMRKSEKIVITTHVNPDGDAIGSALGLWNALRERGKTALIINHSQTPANLRFLSGSEYIRVYDAQRDFTLIASADAVFVLDVNNTSRIESVAEAIIASNGQKIVIDHHREPQKFADIYAIDIDASSTSEMIARLLFAEGGKLSPETASALYAGIMTDSGNFRYPRSDAELYRIAATLIEAGADPVEIYERVYNNGSIARANMLGRALAGAELFADGAVCVMTVSRNDFYETSANTDDTDGFVQHTLSISGVKLGILIVELDGIVKTSFRSKGNVSAVKIAKEFNGGGHFNAAAARFYNISLREARDTVIARAIAEIA